LRTAELLRAGAMIRWRGKEQSGKEEEEEEEEGKGSSSPAAPRIAKDCDGRRLLNVCGGFGQVMIVTEEGNLLHSGSSNIPAAAAQQEDERFVVVSSGSQHTLLLSADGVLWAGGQNTYGQLGYPGEAGASIARAIPSLRVRRVTMMGCGEYHSVCLTEDGDVYTWGKGSDGQLGLGRRESSPVPRFVSSLGKEKVSWVGAGWNFTGAVTQEGKLYMWGDNSLLQLGLGRSATRQLGPAKVLFDPHEAGEEEIEVEGVACGFGHACCWTRKGIAFSWGFGVRGQLGHGDVASQGIPKAIGGDLEEEKVKSIVCGSQFSAALTEGGRVFVWGSASHHRLGIEEEEDRLVPTLVNMRGCEVKQLAACEDRMIAFAPARIFRLEPDCGPVEGGTRVKVRGNGFFQTDRIRVSLSFIISGTQGEEEEGGGGRREVYLCRGAFDPSCGMIVFDTPRMTRAASCSVEVSLDDGSSFTSSGTTFSYYSLPVLSSIHPHMRIADGTVPLLLCGQGLSSASPSFCKVRLVQQGSGRQVTLPGTWKEEEGAIEVLSPSMDAGAARVELALNGQQFVSSQLSITFFLMPEVLDVVPDCCPSAGGELRLELKNPNSSLLVRLLLPSQKEILLQAHHTEISSSDPSKGRAAIKIPQLEEEGPAELAVSVDGKSFARAEKRLFVFGDLQPSLSIPFCSLQGGSGLAIVSPSMFPAAGWRVRVGKAEVGAKFRSSWGELGPCVSFETPAGEEAGVKGEEDRKVEVAVSPDGKTWLPCAQLSYFEPISCADLKPNKSGKDGASATVTISGSGFIESEHVFVKFQMEESSRCVRGEFVSETAVSVTTPEVRGGEKFMG